VQPAVHIAAKVPPDLADAFRARAAAEDRTTSSLLRVAMRRVLDRVGAGAYVPRPSHTTGHAGPHPAVHVASRKRR
jgi:hypothetical protein